MKVFWKLFVSWLCFSIFQFLFFFPPNPSGLLFFLPCSILYQLLGFPPQPSAPEPPPLRSFSDSTLVCSLTYHYRALEETGPAHKRRNRNYPWSLGVPFSITLAMSPHCRNYSWSRFPLLFCFHTLDASSFCSFLAARQRFLLGNLSPSSKQHFLWALELTSTGNSLSSVFRVPSPKF